MQTQLDGYPNYLFKTTKKIPTKKNSWGINPYKDVARSRVSSFLCFERLEIPYVFFRRRSFRQYFVNVIWGVFTKSSFYQRRPPINQYGENLVKKDYALQGRRIPINKYGKNSCGRYRSIIAHRKNLVGKRPTGHWVLPLSVSPPKISKNGCARRKNEKVFLSSSWGVVVRSDDCSPFVSKNS